MKERPKQFAERDLVAQLKWPTLSWSAMHSFLEYDKNEWYNSYVLGIRKPPNNAMKIGIEVGERIVADPSFLQKIERPEIYEQNLSGALGHVKITGHLDGWSPSIPAIDEYKTSTSKGRWTQAKVDTWGQLTFYCLLVYLHYKITPEQLRLRLWSIPIEERGDFSYTVGDPVCFTTKRTLSQMLTFGALIKQTHSEMLEFIKVKESSK